MGREEDMRFFFSCLLFWVSFYFLISPLNGLGVEHWIKIVTHFAILAIWTMILIIYNDEIFKIISSRYCCGWMLKLTFFKKIFYIFSPPELYFGSTTAKDLVKKFDDPCVLRVKVRYSVPFLGYPGIWDDISKQLREYNSEVQKVSSGKVEFGFESRGDEENFYLHYFKKFW